MTKHFDDWLGRDSEIRGKPSNVSLWLVAWLLRAASCVAFTLSIGHSDADFRYLGQSGRA